MSKTAHTTSFKVGTTNFATVARWGRFYSDPYPRGFEQSACTDLANKLRAKGYTVVK